MEKDLIADPVLQVAGSLFFALAVTHTFLASRFARIARKYPNGSVGENFFHFMGEVEVVFGLWAAVLLLVVAARYGLEGAIHYMDSLNFTEPAFVFVIMAMAGTRPIIKLAELIILGVSRFIPLQRNMAFYVSTLVLGPLLGSFITEPAAMTVTALILLEAYYKREMSRRFKYATVGLLFVNVSIGGTLTHFAAPPVLMVAAKWGWGMSHMTSEFGYKAAIAVVVNTLLTAFIFARELKGEIPRAPHSQPRLRAPWWTIFAHVVFLALVVRTAHHMAFFMGVFLFFLGFATVTKEYQDRLKLREALLVSFFLGGLVTLGSLQGWWLQPLLSRLGDLTLFLGATSLTAITDNAALTYLGSLVEGLSESSKYSLVAGAVTGGGLTVIANAPNPAGYGILKASFGGKGLSPLGLLMGALIPTLIAAAAFLILPSL